MSFLASGKRYYAFWKRGVFAYRQKIAISIIFAILAVILNLISGSYTERVGTAVIPDMILNNIPSYDLSLLYVGLFVIVVLVFILYPIIFQPTKIYYMIGMFSFFGVVKAGFSVLTHLRIPNGAVDISWTPFFYDWFAFSNYLFFAGNVGLAFLGYLMYRKNKIIGYFMLIVSVILALSALLMHRHYTIDIISAFFIAYGVYKIGNFIFND